jgi:hypothetical protein
MRELMRRLEKLEQQVIEAGECECGQSMRVIYPGDPMPEQVPDCSRHGAQRVLQVQYVSPPATLDN